MTLQRRAKIAAARRGKRRPPEFVEKIRKAKLGTRASAATRAKMRAAHLARGTRQPWLNKPWEPWEDELLRMLPLAEVAKRTGRTTYAVSARRHVLGVPDGRRREERLKVGRSK